jgi:hypothetical protein
MSVPRAHLTFAANLPSMPDEEILQAWQVAVAARAAARITLVYSAAIARFGLAHWRQRYMARLPDQTKAASAPAGYDCRLPRVPATQSPTATID